MCEPLPAPRCSHHLRINLERAKATGSTQEIRVAQEAYARSKRGTDELRSHARALQAAGKTAAASRLMTRADTYDAQRSAQTVAYRKGRTRLAAAPETSGQELSEMLQSTSETVETKRVAAMNLATKSPMFSSFTPQQIMSMFKRQVVSA